MLQPETSDDRTDRRRTDSIERSDPQKRKKGKDMEGQIKVTAQELINASSDFEARNASVNDITAQMLNLARNLSSQWEGEAATAYINKFNELEDDMQLISKKITEHVTDLQEMASIYENAERLAQESGSGLNAQLIS